MTPEREKYHELLAEFAATLPDGASVYDIGCTHAHEYSEWFPRQVYLSIDRRDKAEPDLAIDVEAVPQNYPEEPYSGIVTRNRENIVEFHHKCCDSLLCNGVTESANDPFRLASGCFRLMKCGAKALFGIRLTGYPVSDKHDLARFTAAGAVHLVETAGFTVEASHIVERDGVPSYAFLTCRRPPC